MSKRSPDKARSWPIRVIALLLILQAVGLVGINAYHLSSQASPDAEINVGLETLQEINELPPEQIGPVKALISALLLAPLAIPALLAAIGFLFLLRFGWLLAMITQIVILLVCLMLYVEFKPVVIYPAMVYCILIVLYLNVHEVRLAFLTRGADQD